MAKVAHKEFKLTTVAGRIGLLAGITAGTVDRKEVEHAMIADTEKRPYRKPVVAYGVRYDSITAAASDRWNKRALPTLNEQKTEQAYIRKLCNADNVEGFYWSE